MPKTYNTFTNVSTGDVLTATNFNNVLTNVNNYRVAPACAAYHSVAQSIPNATATAVLLNSEYYDTDDMHSTSTATSRITIATAGIYQLTANILFSNAGTGMRDLVFYKNGATTNRGSSTLNITASFFTNVNATTTMSLAASDYIEAYVYHTQGTALDIRGDINGVHVTATWLGQVS
jgi:hypothetical protein